MVEVVSFLAETTSVTTAAMRNRLAREKIMPVVPLLEYALTSTQPASDRALLVRLACQAEGGTLEDALPGMEAWEFLEIGLLVTDDFFDERRSGRMGKTPLSSKVGPKTCVALGFVLKSLAGEAIITGHRPTDRWDVGEALCIIEWASKKQYYSQYQEEGLGKKPLPEVTLGMYFDLIENATSVGVGGALELGCLLGQGSLEDRRKFRDFGITLGNLLQMRDDLIDYIDDESLIGKGPFSDLLCRRRRLPLLAACWEASPAEKERIERILEGDIGPQEINWVLGAITAEKVKRRIRSISAELHNKALAQLDGLPKVEPSRTLFLQLLDLSVDL